MFLTGPQLRYTGSMWISIRNSGGVRSEKVLVSCGPQGWGRPLISVARVCTAEPIGTLANSDSTSTFLSTPPYKPRNRN